ncbi:MAG: hypothetical protein M5R42_10665 [Rhodocyclaceae bacterium]|nr:hypothetical protein [Rhodocyclaceae bacterium]
MAPALQGQIRVGTNHDAGARAELFEHLDAGGVLGGEDLALDVGELAHRLAAVQVRAHGDEGREVDDIVIRREQVAHLGELVPQAPVDDAVDGLILGEPRQANSSIGTNLPGRIGCQTKPRSEEPRTGRLQPVLNGVTEFGGKNSTLARPPVIVLDLRGETPVHVVPRRAIRRGELHLEFDVSAATDWSGACAPKSTGQRQRGGEQVLGCHFVLP